ncbi:MAG: hypothetical protein ACYCU5_01825 [Actinomycetes bacterium]
MSLRRTRATEGPAVSVPPWTPDDGDDLARLLAGRARRRGTHRSTLALAATALVAAGFAGGAYADQQLGHAPATTAATTRRFAGGGFAGAGFAGGGPAGTGTGASGAGGARLTTGTIRLVDGTSVYVQTATGSLVKVTTTATTTVVVGKAATVGSLRAGERVVVLGSTTGQGTVTADQITQGSTSGAAPGTTGSSGG